MLISQITETLIVVKNMKKLIFISLCTLSITHAHANCPTLEHAQWTIPIDLNLEKYDAAPNNIICSDIDPSPPLFTPEITENCVRFRYNPAQPMMSLQKGSSRKKYKITSVNYPNKSDGTGKLTGKEFEQRVELFSDPELQNLVTKVEEQEDGSCKITMNVPPEAEP